MIAKNNNKTTIMIVIINRFNQNVKIYIKSLQSAFVAPY